MLTWIRRQWFVLALVVCLLIGFAGPERLIGWMLWPTLRNAVVILVMLAMMITVDLAAFARQLRRPYPVLWATGINLGISPPIAWLVAGLLSDDLGRGLVVAAAIPCTVASASVWTRKAGGNDAVVILVTLTTNVACFLVTPLWIYVLIGEQVESISAGGLITKLGLLVLMPLILAQGLRHIPKVAAWSDARKGQLGGGAQIGILIMILIGAAATRDQVPVDESVLSTAGRWAGTVLAVAAIHTGLLWGGFYSSRWLRMERADAIAVAISGSQKTLLIGLSVAIEVGASIVPMVSYHVCQLIIDTAVAGRLVSPRNR